MVRRSFIALVSCSAFAWPSDRESLRGKLGKDPSGKPVLRLADGQAIVLSGDAETTGVLNDARLAGAEFEIAGRRDNSGFAIDPIHTAALFAHRNGKRLRVTYWCDICAIRTYTPGLCWCCREETELDLREPDTVDTK
jgi:hypothetical protein